MWYSIVAVQACTRPEVNRCGTPLAPAIFVPVARHEALRASSCVPGQPHPTVTGYCFAPSLSPSEVPHV